MLYIIFEKLSFIEYAALTPFFLTISDFPINILFKHNESFNSLSSNPSRNDDYFIEPKTAYDLEDINIINLFNQIIFTFIHHPQIKYFPNEEFLQLFKLFNQFHPN